MDKIFITNLKVIGILGIHAHEQRTPQEIRVSVIANTDITGAARADDITQTINYATMSKRITKFIQANPCLTIEALIEKLSAEILSEQRISSIWLRIEKPQAVPEADSVGVEITRSR